MSHSVLWLRQLMINLKASEKDFSECSYLALSILLKLLHICMIWLSRLVRSFQSVSVLSCIWRIKSDEILYNSHSNVYLICFERHNCDHYTLKLDWLPGSEYLILVLSCPGVGSGWDGTNLGQKLLVQAWHETRTRMKSDLCEMR